MGTGKTTNTSTDTLLTYEIHSYAYQYQLSKHLDTSITKVGDFRYHKSKLVQENKVKKDQNSPRYSEAVITATGSYLPLTEIFLTDIHIVFL